MPVTSSKDPVINVLPVELVLIGGGFNIVNGVSGLDVTPPFTVMVELLLLESTNGLKDEVFNNRVVLAVAVNGLVGGVKLPEYNALPLTILKLEIYPF
jgi:hypothetical protein